MTLGSKPLGKVISPSNSVVAMFHTRSVPEAGERARRELPRMRICEISEVDEEV